MGRPAFDANRVPRPCGILTRVQRRPSLRRLLALYRGRDLPPTVRALGTTSFFQDVASEMVYPLLPAFLITLGGGPVLLGAMESLSEGLLALLKGAAGRWSDRSGRRKPWVSAGYGLSALTRPLLAFAAAAWHVVGLRALDRVAKGLRTAPRDAWIAEITRPEERGFAFSFHRGLDHLGAAAGPLLAALVLLVVPGRERWVFALATVPAVIGWAVVTWGTNPPSAPGNPPPAPPLRKGERKTPEARNTESSPGGSKLPPVEKGGTEGGFSERAGGGFLAFFLFSLGNATDAFLLLAAAQAGYPPLGLTLLWSGFHVVKSLASVPGGRLADRVGPRPPILAGWGLYALVYLGFALSPGPRVLALLFALYAVHYGLTEGAARAMVVEWLGGRTAPAPGAGKPCGTRVSRSDGPTRSPGSPTSGSGSARDARPSPTTCWVRYAPRTQS